MRVATAFRVVALACVLYALYTRFTRVHQSKSTRNSRRRKKSASERWSAAAAAGNAARQSENLLVPEEEPSPVAPAPIPPPIERSLIREASREWPNGTTITESLSSSAADAVGCSELLRQHGLCDPALLRLPDSPTPHALARPFVFLHFSKCAGTSLLAQLEPMGWQYYSLYLPQSVVTAARTNHDGPACSASVSAKCCWWLERARNFSANRESVKVLTLEPANDAPSVSDDGRLGFEPGFDAPIDHCAGLLAYLTVLRPPMGRVHSHMCERAVGFQAWQRPLSQSASSAFAMRRQLRDNYYVRSLGGKSAWEAPEGGIRAEHLLTAAKTLALFDVVMTVPTLSRDAPKQMGRVGLPGFVPRHVYSRSRAENLQRAANEPKYRIAKRAACQVPPTAAELKRLVAACAWDSLLYEFARKLAERRTSNDPQVVTTGL